MKGELTATLPCFNPAPDVLAEITVSLCCSTVEPSALIVVDVRRRGARSLPLKTAWMAAKRVRILVVAKLLCILRAMGADLLNVLKRSQDFERIMRQELSL